MDLEGGVTDEPHVDSAAGIRQSAFDHIELVWPGKDLPEVPHQEPNGRWILQPKSPTNRLRPLVITEEHGSAADPIGSLVVVGDRLDGLTTLRRRYPRAAQFAYLDVPRIEIDDKSAAFQGDATYAYSTWLSVLRSHLEAIAPILDRTGVVAIHTGDVEEPYARLLAGELLGRDNYVGTVVWQRSYGPRNMRGMKEFTATHDCITLFALDKFALRPVGLREDPADAGFSNPDDDPRMEWKAAHKGARTRRERSDFNTYIPPYRWTIVDGRLPEGVWRLNPLTGVIWGTPAEPGDFPLEIEVTDAAGDSERASTVLHCRRSGTPPELPDIPWLFAEIVTSGRLRIPRLEFPEAVVGREYSAICLAEGGTPHRAPPKRPGSGRYWEFADETLRVAYGRDMVDLGKDGDVIPRIKTYAGTLGGEVVKNQQTWWPAKAKDGSPFAGFTQDATKHLKKLREVGLISETITSAKPEHLLARLVQIFSAPGDIVLEVFGVSADLAAVALKTGRPFVYLAGATERDVQLLDGCAIPRLRAVVDGQDNDLHIHEGEIRMSEDAYIPYEGGGRFVVAGLGDWILEQGTDEDFPRMNREYATDEKALMSALLTSQGFMPVSGDDSVGIARHDHKAVVVPPDQYLTPNLAARLVSESSAPLLTVFYFMSTEDFDPSVASPTTVFRRVPSELTLHDR